MELIQEEKNQKNFKLWLFIFGSSMLAGLIVYGFTSYAFAVRTAALEQEISSLQQELAQQKQLAVVAAAQNINQQINGGVKKLALPNTAVPAPASLIASNVLLARKNKFRVTVLHKNLITGAEETILEYDEAIPAERSGNTWEEQPPSVALSADKSRLAYIDKQGLKTYDLASKKSKTVITKVKEGNGEMQTPTWSVKELNSFDLVRPRWSFDSQYLSFHNVLYEGSSQGIINIYTGKHTRVSGQNGQSTSSFRLSWSPKENSILLPSTYGYSSAGLFVSQAGTVEKIVDIAEKFNKGESVFTHSAFSNDGNKIAYVYDAGSEGAADNGILGVVNRDGSNATTLAANLDVYDLAFAPDNSHVVTIERVGDAFLLALYDLSTQSKKEVIQFPDGFKEWDDLQWLDNYLAINGWSQNNERRVVLLDYTTGALVYVSQPLPDFTHLVGFFK